MNKVRERGGKGNKVREVEKTCLLSTFMYGGIRFFVGEIGINWESGII